MNPNNTNAPADGIEVPRPGQRKRVQRLETRHVYTIPVVRELPTAIEHDTYDATW